jgi:hypothetical protein
VGQPGARSFVAAAGTDTHEPARGERRSARTAGMQSPAARACDPDRALQLILVREVRACPVPLSRNAPQNPVGAGALSDQHFRAVYGDSHGRYCTAASHKHRGQWPVAAINAVLSSRSAATEDISVLRD